MLPEDASYELVSDAHRRLRIDCLKRGSFGGLVAARWRIKWATSSLREYLGSCDEDVFLLFHGEQTVVQVPGSIVADKLWTILFEGGEWYILTTRDAAWAVSFDEYFEERPVEGVYEYWWYGEDSEAPWLSFPA